MLQLSLIHLVLVVVAAAEAPVGENAVFKELVAKGVTMSDGTAFKLPPPILADGLDAAANRRRSPRRPRPRYSQGVPEQVVLCPGRGQGPHTEAFAGRWSGRPRRQRVVRRPRQLGHAGVEGLFRLDDQ